MGSHGIGPMAMILEIALVYLLWQAIRQPVEAWEGVIRTIVRRPVPLALAPAPEPVKPVRARRPRAKAAA